MTEAQTSHTPQTPPAPAAAIRVAPSPHLSNPRLTTRRMMVDVLIALGPVLAVAVVVFRWYAVVQVGLCVLACLATEAVCERIRGKPLTLGDGSAVVTGTILGLSLPWSAPWYIAVLASVIGIGLGKVVFGGLGCNLFNPAMVGRAFVMLSFAKELAASAYTLASPGSGTAGSALERIVTEATPLTLAKEVAGGASASLAQFWPLFVGNVNGSLGEISAAALLLGGLYLCVRRVASWEIPVGMLLAGFACAEAAHRIGLTPCGGVYHLIAGALLFGAFFIATDPVTSPVTSRGKFVFGLGIGGVVIVIRIFSNYPEGVMFAVLLLNAAVPLINRFTVPRPLGGPLPEVT